MSKIFEIFSTDARSMTFEQSAGAAAMAAPVCLNYLILMPASVKHSLMVGLFFVSRLMVRPSALLSARRRLLKLYVMNLLKAIHINKSFEINIGNYVVKRLTVQDVSALFKPDIIVIQKEQDVLFDFL